MKLEWDVQEVRLRAPFLTAAGELQRRPLVRVRLLDPDGLIGEGEAAPLRSHDGVAVEDVVAELERVQPAVERGDSLDEVLPQALAGIDLARWDLRGQREGQPVWRLLGSKLPAPVAVNATIAVPDRTGAATRAAAARAAKFTCVKVKVGLGDDPGRLAAVRAAAGPHMAIRLDANGTWEAEEAVSSLRALAPVGIELCEEPVHGLAELGAVAAISPVPVGMDESTSLPGALEHRYCTAVCLKLSACGGISGLVTAAKRARRAGYEVYLASTLDGPRGIAGALHAAAIIQPDRHCGLATLPLLDVPDPLPVRAGSMLPPSRPGLGV